ncbi:unnamed protein product, partial [Amoebophrya sp. A25]
VQHTLPCYKKATFLEQRLVWFPLDILEAEEVKENELEQVVATTPTLRSNHEQCGDEGFL